ncbi:hypothetical protein IJ596_01095, partial [bacterium]|nr:hypothetical protein [bacterium]
MKQICIILGIVIFALVTFYILESDETKNLKRVYIQSQSMALSQQGAGITAQEISFQQNETDIEKRKILINNPNANTEKRIINYQSNENQLDREIRQFDI